MKCVIGVGSNLGDRRAHLEFAAQRLAAVTHGQPKVSPIYTTAALLPENGPDSWRIPYLNAAIEIDWSQSAHDLLRFLKAVELEAGRAPGERWAPRPLDLDLLFFGDERIQTTDLQVPHPSLLERAFVLDPLKDLQPQFLSHARALKDHAPLWMGILNLTPDSFSDGGDLSGEGSVLGKAEALAKSGVQILDFGAESTRPGATPLASRDEWARLEQALGQVTRSFQSRIFRPLISLDTRHAETARRALHLGVDWINDVSGLRDPQMLEVLKDSKCEYVLMHSLSVPANAQESIHEGLDVVAEVKAWAREKFDQLSRAGVSLERVIFDPGIGFGKTPQQSITLLKRIDEFFDLPTRILVGHSRKGFLKTWTEADAAGRDPETLGVSLRLADCGVDILRVHEPEFQMRAFHAFREARR